MARFGVMKHLRVLEDAGGPVDKRPAGREKHHCLNRVPNPADPRPLDQQVRGAPRRAARRPEERIGGRSMSMRTSTATQVYQVFIKASAERIWEAITSPELRSKYFFGEQLESSFEPGTALRTWSPDGTVLRGDNIVLEAEPPGRLVHTWRSLWDEELAAEDESRVTWEIEPNEG